MTYQEMMNEVDLLKGCINRICITDDYDELLMLYASAKNRLIAITEYHISRVDIPASEQIEGVKYE